ncbi:uncharacterized protein LOC129767080 [Toxorhynchites rutilus septentrionalis]|uniref:uncharacterized protein LOC129767080 n=1 Tax=Toxorhynchites rutilus septentrionalis TaxID=329112 RepID=UPI00247A7E3A|nr:uncharacterized protein LOC129767080 [Toxorhynchites rutilus septentrionalis]
MHRDIVYLNIARLRCHFDEFKLMIEQIEPKIVILTETHLTQDRDFEEFEIPKYKFSACLSRSAHTGGVVIYMDERLNYKTISNTTAGDNWFLAVEVIGSCLAGIYGGVYHSSSSSHTGFIECFERWLEDVFTEEKRNVIVGDFNIRWNESGYARELKNVVEALGMNQLVSEPTRVAQISSTIIDLVFSNVGNTTRINLPERKTQIVSWKRYSRERLQAILRADVTLARTSVSVNYAAEQLSVSLVSAVKQLTETADLRLGRSQSWYGADLRGVKAERDRVYRTWKRTRSLCNLIQYRLLRNVYVRELRASKNKAVQREIERCNGDSKKLWKCLKSLIKPGGNATMEIIFDVKRSGAETAGLLNTLIVKSVEEIRNMIPSPSSTIQEKEEAQSCFDNFQPISMWKLKQTVTNLKDCSGVDNITKRVMIDSFNHGMFPEAWKKTVVIPIPKIPKSTRPEDHRPINILPLYEKVLETIVKEQLMAYVERTGILLEEQSDLKRAFETIDWEKLKRVLKRIGIRGTVLDWFHSYLENRVQVTKYNGCISPTAEVNLGVPQGSKIAKSLKMADLAMCSVLKRIREMHTIDRQVHTKRHSGNKDRKLHLKVLRMIKANPGQSDYDIAKKFNADRCTVRKIRLREGKRSYRASKQPNRTLKQNVVAKGRARKLYNKVLTKYDGCILMDDETYVKMDLGQLPGQNFIKPLVGVMSPIYFYAAR